MNSRLEDPEFQKNSKREFNDFIANVRKMAEELQNGESSVYEFVGEISVRAFTWAQDYRGS